MVPLQTYAFSLFDICNCKHRAVLILDFYRFCYVYDMVRNATMHFIRRYLFVSLCKCIEILHNARGRCIGGQVAKDNSNPTLFTQAARIVSEPKFNRIFCLILRTVFTKRFEKLVYMLECVWVVEFNQANCLRRVSLSTAIWLLHAFIFVCTQDASFFAVTFGANGSLYAIRRKNVLEITLIREDMDHRRPRVKRKLVLIDVVQCQPSL